MNWIVLKRELQMASKCMKKVLTSSAIKEILIPTPLRLSPVRMTVPK